MKQRSVVNVLKLPMTVALLSVGACGDGSAIDLQGARGASSASVVELMPGCVDAAVPLVPAVGLVPLVVAKALNIWPPNHKFHSIDVADCVSVAGVGGLSGVCDPGITAEFIWGSSDEPVDSIGDGHHAPDIFFDDCGHVQVRAERQGPKDGRVYRLGVRVVDGRGNVAESSCSVVVDHDQRGVLGADSGESYRVFPSDSLTGLVCDGRPELPPVPVPVPVPVPAPVPAPAPVPVDAGTSVLVGI